MPRLTDTTARKLELAPGKSEALVMDQDLAGFGLRIRSGGARVWIVQHRALGSRKVVRHTLGSIDRLKAAEARDAARAMLSAAALRAQGLEAPALGRDRAPRGPTFGDLADAWLSEEVEPKRRASTAKEYRRHVTRDLAELRDRPAAEITRRDVSQVLEAVERRAGSPSARAVRATLSSLYAWALERSRLPDDATSPVVGAYKPDGAKDRERVLSDAELGAIVAACRGPAGGRDVGTVVELLVLTGCRREEVGALMWSEVDLDGAAMNLPGSRTKNGRPHLVPLSPRARAMLEARALALADGDRAPRDHVFGRTADAGFSGWSKAVATITTASGVSAWTLHDLRRTFVTRANELGLADPHVIEASVNHVSGSSKAGVAGVYNRAAYLAERVELARAWAEHVEAIVTARTG